MLILNDLMIRTLNFIKYKIMNTKTWYSKKYRKSINLNQILNEINF
jgi:hypothetical protein